MRKFLAPAVAAGVFTASSALAAPFTTNSPVGGELPSGITEVGGIVFDAIGTNGARVTSQLSADSLFTGFTGSVTGEIEIGSQAGYDDSILGVLGGGIMQLAIRVTLEDGDSAPGDFDEGDNELLVNGISVGNFSDVTTISTDGMGNEIAGSNTTGFADGEVDTGFFVVTDAAILTQIFASLQTTGELSFSLLKLDTDNQRYDFTEGIDGSLIGVGSGPVVTPVPVPMAALLFAPALGALGVARRRKRG